VHQQNLSIFRIYHLDLLHHRNHGLKSYPRNHVQASIHRVANQTHLSIQNCCPNSQKSNYFLSHPSQFPTPLSPQKQINAPPKHIPENSCSKRRFLGWQTLYPVRRSWTCKGGPTLSGIHIYRKKRVCFARGYEVL